MKKLKRIINKKNVLFLVLGIITSIVPTYYAAETLFASDEVSYSNTASQLVSTDVQGALDELYSLANNPRVLPVPDTPFELGDYFTMVPDASTYTITAGTTGYTSDQTITPNELTLWRIIDIHSDGSVDAVSEYVSSTSVYFRGVTGYANFVGGLQTIAAQYAKVGYTINTRMMGYGGQTATIQPKSSTCTGTCQTTTTYAFDGSTTTAPSTTDTLSPYIGEGQEYNGGVLGDTLYLKDIQLVGDVYKSDTSTYGTYGLKAYKVNATTTNGNYWLASRRFNYSDATYFRFSGRSMYSGSLYNVNLRYFDSGWRDVSFSYSLRPIITLKSGITLAGGSGTKADPYTIS